MFSLHESTMFHLCAHFRRHENLVLGNTKKRCPHCSSQPWKGRRQPARQLQQEPRAELPIHVSSLPSPPPCLSFLHSNEEMVLMIEIQWKQQVFLSTSKCQALCQALGIGRNQMTWSLLSPITGCWRPPFHRAGRERGRTGCSGAHGIGLVYPN